MRRSAATPPAPRVGSGLHRWQVWLIFDLTMRGDDSRCPLTGTLRVGVV